MERVNEEVHDQLELLKENTFFAHVVSLILGIMNKSSKIVFDVIHDEGVITLTCKSEIAPFTFCFWTKEQSRLSFFIDDREVLDEYITNEAEASDCVQFLTIILSNNLEIKSYRRIRDKKVFKKTYKYFIVGQSGKPIVFEDKAVFGINLFWNKFTIDKKVVSPVL